MTIKLTSNIRTQQRVVIHVHQTNPNGMSNNRHADISVGLSMILCTHVHALLFLMKTKPVMQRKPTIENREFPRWWVLIKPNVIKDRSRTYLGHDVQRRIIFFEKKVEFQYDVICGINNSIFYFYNSVYIVTKWSRIQLK